MKNLALREVEIGRVNTILEKMAQPNFEGFSIFAFGYTHASNLADIPKKLNGAVSLLHQGAGVKGIWRIVPLPKPKSFSFFGP